VKDSHPLFKFVCWMTTKGGFILGFEIHFDCFSGPLSRPNIASLNVRPSIYKKFFRFERNLVCR